MTAEMPGSMPAIMPVIPPNARVSINIGLKTSFRNTSGKSLHSCSTRDQSIKVFSKVNRLPNGSGHGHVEYPGKKNRNQHRSDQGVDDNFKRSANF